MKHFIRKLALTIVGGLSLLLCFQLPAIAQTFSNGGGTFQTGFWSRIGTAIVPSTITDTIGSSSNRIAAIYATLVDATTVAVGSFSSGGITVPTITVTSTAADAVSVPNGGVTAVSVSTTNLTATNITATVVTSTSYIGILSGVGGENAVYIKKTTAGDLSHLMENTTAAYANAVGFKWKTATKQWDVGALGVNYACSDCWYVFDSTNAAFALMISATRNVSIGPSTTMSTTDRLRVAGADTGSTNFTFRAQDSGGTSLFSVRNDGLVTMSGSLTLSGLTASRAVFTTSGSVLTTSGTSANLASSLSDETGTGVAVFNTTPSFTGGTTFAATFGSGSTFSVSSDAYVFSSAPTGKNAGFGANRDDFGTTASFDLLTSHLSASGWSMQMQPNDTTMYVVDRASSTNVMAFKAGGNIGIGDSTPLSLLTVGSGDLFQVNSSGAIAAATGITSSGSITFSGLTASRAVFTTTGGLLTSTGASSDLSSSLSDETGTGVAVFGTSPTFTTKLTSPLILGGTAVGSTLTLQSTSGVGTTDAIIFNVGNNGATEAGRFTSGGNLGIGIAAPNINASPAQFIHVNASGTNAGAAMHFTNGTTGSTATDGLLVGISTDNINYFFDYEATSLVFGTTGAARITVDSSGNVGVGDASPAAMFVVGNGDLFRVTSGGLVLLPAGASGAAQLALSTTGDTNTGLYFSAADTIKIQTGGIDRLTIDSAGLFGIGPNAPAAKLDVESTAGGAASGIRLVQLAENGAAASSYTPIDFTVPTVGLIGQLLATANNYVNAGINAPSSSIALMSEAGSLSLMAASTTGDMRFNTGGYAVANERIRITSAGNVGIGDTTPAALLTVGNGDLFQVNSSGVIAAAAGITSSGAITFSSLGAPGSTGSYVCWITGALSQQLTTCTVSSEFYKEHIRKLSDADMLKESLALQPVVYNFKEGYGSSDDQKGFIAEQVAKIDPTLAVWAESTPEHVTWTKEHYPSLVIEHDGKTLVPNSLDYERISVINTGAIHSLNSRLSKIEKRLK